MAVTDRGVASRQPDPLALSRRRDGWSIGIGVVAILCWGLLFDQLARVGRWIFDTTYLPAFHTMADLHYRYRDAHQALLRHHLYGYRHGAFTYPPITAYLFAPFRLVGLHATEVLWTVGNLVVLAVFIALIMWKWLGVRLPTAWLAAACGLAPAAVFLFYPFRSLLIWGQLGLYLLFVIFVDLFIMPARFRGLLVGAVTAVKLLPGIFVLWFLARRDVPAALRAAAAFVALTLTAWVIWPHASAQYWFHILPSGKDVLMVSNPTNLPTSHLLWYNGVGKTANQSLRGLLGRPPFFWTATFPWVLLAIGVLALGLYVMYRLLRQRRELLAFFVLSLTTVLISPVSWIHYWVFAGLAPLVALVEWRRDRPSAIAALVLAVSVCANLEDTSLTGLYTTGHFITNMAPTVIFVVRNLYVLGGLVFMGVVSVRAVRGGLPESDLGTWRLSARPTPSR